MIGIPAIISIKEVLKLWLGDVPQYTDVFVSLLLVNGLVACLNSGFDALIQASGKIRRNQIGYSLINISLLPIIYILYKLGCPCYANVVVMIILSIATIVFQCYIMKRVSNFQLGDYFNSTILPSFVTTLLASMAFVLVLKMPTTDFISLVTNSLLAVVWVAICILLLGLNKTEKLKLKNILIHKILKKNG